MKHIKVMS